jgi:hypothetical protein
MLRARGTGTRPIDAARSDLKAALGAVALERAGGAGRAGAAVGPAGR